MIRQHDDRYFGARSEMATLAGLQISHAVYQPDMELPLHWHSRPYVCLVAMGDFEERAEGRVAACAAGTALFNPSRSEHEDSFGKAGAQIWNLELTDAWNERLAEATAGWTPVQGAEARWLVARMIRELRNPDSASALSLEGLLCALVGEASHCPVANDARRPTWLARALDRLRADFREPPRVGELAQEAGVHRSHFSRAFRRHAGCTVADFVRRLRINWAAEQLQRHHCTLTEVALEAGFGDQSHFSRTFKRVTGVTPGAYRAAAHRAAPAFRRAQ